MDVGEEESQSVAGLGGEDGEEGNKVRRLVVGQVCEDEGLGVVLVDSGCLSACAMMNEWPQSHCELLRLQWGVQCAVEELLVGRT